MSSAAEIEQPTTVPRGAPLGPGSLLWEYFGDHRLKLFFGRSGTLQNMHPAVSAALQQHSNFFDDPWDRLLRSVPRIEDSIYDPPESAASVRVRDYHRDIKGVDHHGQRYHALNPDIFWWTHVTFVEAVMAMNEYFGTPLTGDQKQQLWAEGVTWWERYGLSAQPVFGTYEEFQAYWEHMLADELEANETTDFALRAAGIPIPPVPGVPTWAWTVIRRPFMEFNVWLLAAMMPERGREILGIDWNRLDEFGFRVFAGTVRRAWPLLPRPLRYDRRVYRKIRAAEQGLSQGSLARPA
ncbi:oxygenase MpaB family protein [Nocardia sp. NPDC005746]|uniref:oxygenase MpaB family protein n=1 Tax=Nocardia sp. NPDC005746 TaxID=3157062 RepID=UPI0033E8D336